MGVLKGASIFMADLARAMKTPARFEFVGIASYSGTTTSGEGRLTKDLDHPIEGFDVIVVEDIVDTGITLTYFLQLLQQRKPKSLRIAALLDKPSRRRRPVHVDYVGFEVPDQFLVGYSDWTIRRTIAICRMSASWKDRLDYRRAASLL